MVEDGYWLEVFEFPIQETNRKDRMNNINPYLHPQFYDLTMEDPELFHLILL